MESGNSKIGNKPISGPMYTEQEAARKVGLSVSTLQKHRHRCIGMTYCKIGRSIRYPESSIQEFLDKHLVKNL